jgi:hypothetical protein
VESQGRAASLCKVRFQYEDSWKDSFRIKKIGVHVMQYQVYATRTKGTIKRVLVAESVTPYTPSRLAELKTHLVMRSLEFDETVRLEPETRKPV